VGGIYLLVFIPIAIVVVVVLVGYTIWARSAQTKQRSTGPEDLTPHAGRTNTAAAPSTPDDLVDAKQKQ